MNHKHLVYHRLSVFGVIEIIVDFYVELHQLVTVIVFYVYTLIYKLEGLQDVSEYLWLFWDYTGYLKIFGTIFADRAD